MIPEKDKRQCKECSGYFKNSDLLTAKNPFDNTEDIQGCPDCKSINNFLVLCYELGCNKPPNSGASSKHGYMLTCSNHWYGDKE